ncbi:MAG: DNA translocase FtsK 4TM domain-containing protein, partial [Alistipes sp.]|nr:DNA translocase FtsK 4TM domain-containing protein [Alistipes sp.]
MAEQLIGRSFGLFGLIIPMVVMTLGLRVIRRRPLVLNHSLLSALLVLLLGSLTLGYAFGMKWNMFNSGWGGAYGIELADLLHDSIGGVGTLILLLVGWILT